MGLTSWQEEEEEEEEEEKVTLYHTKELYLKWHICYISYSTFLYKSET
jgi:hypothetical protein